MTPWRLIIRKLVGEPYNMSIEEIGNLTFYQLQMLICEESWLTTRITGESPADIMAQQKARYAMHEKARDFFVERVMREYL